MVYDHRAKKNIEVDVLLEFSTGGVKYRTGIECRDHARKGEPDWIRALATKRDDCRLDKIVAVHSRGFTKGAVELAQEHHILALTFQDIPLTQASNSLATKLFGKPLISWSILRVELGVLDTDDVPDDELTNLSATHFFLADKLTAVPIRDVVDAHLSESPPNTDQILEGHCVELEGNLPLRKTEYYVRCKDRFVRVGQLKVLVRAAKARILTGAHPMHLRDTENHVIGQMVAQEVPGPGGVYSWSLTVDDSEKPHLAVGLPASVHPLDFAGKLHVTYTEKETGEQKSVCIPGQHIVVDQHGTQRPVYRFRVRILGVSHDGPAELQSGDILGFYASDASTPVQIERLISEEVRRSGLPADGIQAGERRRVNAQVKVQGNENQALLMQVRTATGSVFANVSQIRFEVEFWRA